MERRRLAAGRDLARLTGSWGEKARLAERYGVSRATITRWDAKRRREGLASLRGSKAPGQPTRLSVKQREKLREALLAGAVAQGFQTEVWTGPRVALVIRKRFGVTYNARYIPHLLDSQLGFSWQKPDRRPRELDPVKVRKFQATWRAVKKTHLKENARSGSSMNLDQA